MQIARIALRTLRLLVAIVLQIFQNQNLNKLLSLKLLYYGLLNKLPKPLYYLLIYRNNLCLSNITTRYLRKM